MTNDQLQGAIALRDERALGVVLEASGGVRLETIAAIAATGIDRISVGALTHSAIGLDLGLDWRPVGGIEPIFPAFCCSGGRNLYSVGKVVDRLAVLFTLMDAAGFPQRP